VIREVEKNARTAAVVIGDPVTEKSSRHDAEPVNLYAAAHMTRRQKRPLLPK
jgi:hypothetical protein